jgi:TolB-like protein
MGEPPLQVPPPGQVFVNRLDSWKEIAAYLDRDVTTAQRWEKREGMPVHRHLHDTRGSVYALSGELDAWLESRNRGSDPEPAVEIDSSRTGEIKVRQPGAKWQQYLLVVGCVVVAGLITYGCVRLWERRMHTHQPAIRSIAVLPLKNLSADPTQQYLADGMTEALISRLSSIHDLRVISRTSVMRFKDTELAIPSIAESLRVDGVVEGSVIRDGDRVRVTPQLIRAASDEHIWSQTYDRNISDVLSLQSDIAQSIADKVEVTVSGKEHNLLRARRQVSPEVYESFLKGGYASFNTKSDVEKGIGFLKDAISKDPTFAPAYLGLANAYGQLGTAYGGAPPSETRPKSLAAVRKALDLDPNLAGAHILLGDMYQEEWSWQESEAESGHSR